MGAIKLVTEIPGPRSQALAAERARWVAPGIATAKHGVYFEAGCGAQLVDVDGNVFVDFMGGIGCLNSGHSAPGVIGRAQEQLAKLQHLCFGAAPYEVYVRLAKKVCEISPVPQPSKACFFNSGSEAVENAVKVARKATGRAAVIAFDPGFHGRTYLALALTSKANPYRDGFGPLAPEVYRFALPDLLRKPKALSEAEVVARAIEEFHHFLKSTVSASQVAAVIFEPVIGEGGFLVPPRAFTDDVVKTCRENGIVLIADEIQSGFARTGRMFACEHAGIAPDLVVLAKSLSNGLPLSAVVGRAELMDKIPAGGLGGTFAGNPVSCAAALGAIETIEREDLCGRARAIGERVGARFAAFKARFPFVGDARGIGAMRALELVKPGTLEADKDRCERVVKLAAKKGLLLISAGLGANVIRTLMPLVIGDAELDEGLDVLERALADS